MDCSSILPGISLFFVFLKPVGNIPAGIILQYSILYYYSIFILFCSMKRPKRPNIEYCSIIPAGILLSVPFLPPYNNIYHIFLFVSSLVVCCAHYADSWWVCDRDYDWRFNTSYSETSNQSGVPFSCCVHTRYGSCISPFPKVKKMRPSYR